MVLGLEVKLRDVAPFLDLKVLLVLFADGGIGMGHVRNVHHGDLECFVLLLEVLLQSCDVIFQLLAFCNQCSAHILLQLALHLCGVLVTLLAKSVQLLLECILFVVKLYNKVGIGNHVPVCDVLLNLLKVFLDEFYV